MQSSTSYDEPLPSYTRRRPSARNLRGPCTPHLFYLSNGPTPWLTLKLTSSAKSPESLPKYFEKDTVKGDVIVVAEPGDSLQSVTVCVTGKLITGAGTADSYTFLDISVPLWTKPSSRSSSPTNPQSENMPSKLYGTYKFPFAIPIPSQVAMDYQTFSLPHSFIEKRTRATVCYELAVRVCRGKMRANSQLKTSFGYVPSSRPSAPSHARRLAYEDNCPIPGPSEDMDGWHNIPGQQLSIASPLSYPRGSVIPLALPPFSDTDAVVLRRRVRYQVSSGVTETIEDDINTAVWWDTGIDLQGEIKLPKDMKPSSSLGRWFDISYAVLVISSLTGAVLAEQPVEIATSYASGPKPLSYAPPPTYTVVPRRKPRPDSSERWVGPETLLPNGKFSQ